MSEPTFTRAAGQPLFTLTLTGMPEGYGMAFLPDSDPDVDSLTLTATWETWPGIYLFFGTTFPDQQALVTKVRDFVGPRTTRFLWIDDPADPISAWVSNEIDLDSADAVSVTAQIAFRNFTLSIGATCAVALNGNSDGFTVTAGGGATIELLTAFGAYSIPATSAVAIAFSGPAAGTLAFSISAGDAQLALLGSGCRYYFDDEQSPFPDMLASVHYPVITLGSGTTTLHPSLDPIHPLSPSRTRFAFLPASGGSGTPFVSGLRTVYGETMLLTPSVSPNWPGGPALVFAVDPQRTTPSSADPYYTTFDGPFTLAVENASQADTPIARMMCGFSGVEYAGLRDSQTNQIAFVSGNAAYAPVLRRTDVVIDLAPVTNSVPLTAVATTAWAMLGTTGAALMDYYAQPHQSILYQPEIALDDPFLSYLEVFAGTFPAVLSRETAVPMVPYGLLDPADANLATDLETQILSPYRRLLLAGILGPTETGGSTGAKPAATPQGVLVTLSENLGYWKNVTFGQTNGGTQKLAFSNVTGGFKSALQSNQLFAVVSNRDELLRCCSVVPPFRLTVSDWTFDLSPSLWEQHDTIMIVKYAAGTVDELTSDAGAWSWPEAANGYSDTSGNTETTQADIRNIIAAAKAASVERSDLAGFVDLVSNPFWNGVLFLRAPLSATSFPDQLRGLAAGIDPARLDAHHVGITLAPVHKSGAALTQEDASIFGLIDYQDPYDLTGTGRPYDYKVLGLTVLFRNSAMANFSSEIELLINELFGSIAIRRAGDARGNNLVLQGFYQSTGATPAYVFVTNELTIYAIGDGTLARIDVARAQFVTLTPAGSGDPDVRTRFILDGRMRFHQVSEFDAFSFGDIVDEDGLVTFDGYLTFSGLLIEMSFPEANPPATVFRFNAGAMAFDTAQSVARPDSLYVHFPLTLTGLIQASAGTKPGDYGFAPMRVTPMRQSGLSDPWYALTFDLTLGTLGALAGDLGLVVSLSAAWCNGNAESRAAVGLHLPGSTGSRAAISLEGVVEMTFRAIEFSAAASPQGIDYILRFRGMTLRVFTLTLPPGSVDLYIFGDPSGGASGSIGWYAAYAKKEKQKSSGTQALREPRALEAGEATGTGGRLRRARRVDP